MVQDANLHPSGLGVIVQCVQSRVFLSLKEIKKEGVGEWGGGELPPKSVCRPPQTESRPGFSGPSGQRVRDSTGVASFFHQVSPPLTSFIEVSSCFSPSRPTGAPPTHTPPPTRLFVPLLFQLREALEESLNTAAPNGARLVFLDG